MNNIAGEKEEKDKLSYELDWTFVEGMAERMFLNKGKYPPYNWQKPIDVEKLNQALVRHFVEIQKGHEDQQQTHGHYYALAVNAMMIVYQLKNRE